MMWPDNAIEKQQAEKLFPDAPVNTDKTWPEMVHRYFAGALGLMILAIVFVAIKARRRIAAAPFKLPLLLLCLVIAQAAFGMWTVTLKLLPQVVTAHLLGGFATLSFLFLLCLRLSHLRRLDVEPDQARSHKDPMGLATVVLVVVLVQVALGGWTSSNYAALACADLPTCQGEWWPEMDFEEGFNTRHEIGPNYEGGVLDMSARTAIHMSHRIGAALVLLLGLMLIWRLRQADKRQLSRLLTATLFLQIALGLSNVWFALPLAIAVSHNLGAALLLLSLIKINYDLTITST
jgi:cytochrome c oxidase assembly protein subunit 15